MPSAITSVPRCHRGCWVDRPYDMYHGNVSLGLDGMTVNKKAKYVKNYCPFINSRNGNTNKMFLTLYMDTKTL